MPGWAGPAPHPPPTVPFYQQTLGPGWYYMVTTASPTPMPGLARMAPGQKPMNVAGRPVDQAVYLGSNYQQVIGNWSAAIAQLSIKDASHITALADAGPPGQGQDTANDHLLSLANQHGGALLTRSSSGAVNDPAFVVIAGGFGAIIGGVLARASGLAAGAAGDSAGAGAGDASGAAAGTAGGGAAGKAASAAGTAAKAVAGAAAAVTLSSLFGNVSLWAGVGMAILGIFLVLFGIIRLSGRDPTQLARRAIG